METVDFINDMFFECNVLNWIKIFKKIKKVTGKTPFFVTGPIGTQLSIRVNIGFWNDSFVWKWSVFNLSTFN